MRFLRARRIHLSRALSALLVLGLLALLLAGCETDTPQNTFDARGEVAARQRDLFYMAMWPAIAILILVCVVLVVALLRFRRRSPDELPKQVHGNTTLELTWTIAPALLLLVLAVPTVTAIHDLGRPPRADAFHVNVTGIQWAWQFEYADLLDDRGQPLTSLGELHVPTGREISLTIRASDVIHSFWVPKLAGKLDAIPGRDNVMWLKADEDGSFSGQCAEFCGRGHAGMKLTLIAQNQEDFQAWANEQRGGGG
ncbi:MAG: cytochrome c oxidase subunit II [Dehalococcoidia bacterium]|nr:cytochrome c oxidase subunit II [Dehalococcoidia bacterium]